MRRSRSRTGSTPSTELAGHRSQLGVGLGSPKPSASASLAGGSRTLIAFSSSASSQGGGSSSIYKRISSHAGSQHLEPMGSASAMLRNVIGQGGILGSTEESPLRMQTSRSDSLIHEMAHSGESRSAAQRTSGIALNGITPIHITPVSSGIESMFDTRTSRDHRVRGKTRSGEGTAALLAQQLEESGSSISSWRARRLSGSQIRQSRSAAMSASRSPTGREEHGALRELVEVEMRGASPTHTRLGTPLTAASKAGSYHSSSEMRRGDQRQTSSSLAANAKSSRSGALQGERTTSSGRVQRYGAASSSEKMASTRSSKAALQSASRTQYESARRQKSVSDKSKTSASKLAAASLTESATRKGLASVPGLFSADATLSTSGVSRIGQGLEMSTTLRAARTATAMEESNVSALTSREKMHAVGSTAESKGLFSSSAEETAKQVSAIGETAPLGTTWAGFKTTTQSASVAGHQGLQQNLLADEKNITSGVILNQKSVSSKLQVQESVQKTLPSDNKSFTPRVADITATIDSTRKHSLLTSSLLQEGAASKSLAQESIQSSKYFSDRSPDMQPVAGTQSKTSTSAEQASLRQTIVEKAAADTLTKSPDMPTFLTPGLLEKKTSSKSVVRESVHRRSFPLGKTDAFSALTDVKGETMSTSIDQGAVQQSLFGSSMTPVTTGLSEKTSLFTSSTPKGTSSKTIIKESVLRKSISSDKAPDTMILSDAQAKTLTAAAQQNAQQTLTGQQATHALLDIDDKGSAMNTSSRSRVQETVHQASYTSQKAPDMFKTDDILGKTTYSTQQATLEQTGSLETAGATLVDTRDKPSLLAPTLLEKRTSSKSLIQKEHRASFPSDKTHTISTLGESIFTTPTLKGTSSKSIIQESAYRRSISSDREPDTAIQSDAQSKTVAAAGEEQSIFQQTITDQQAAHTLFDTGGKAGLEEKTTVALVDSRDKTLLAKRTSSKSLTQESVHRGSLPSDKMAFSSTLTDTGGKTSISMKQETVQHKFLDSATTFTLADSTEKSGLLTGATPERTPSRSLVQESAHRALSSSVKAPDQLTISDVKSTTLTTFKDQGAVQQIVSDKGTAQTRLDAHEMSTVMPPSSLKKRTSSKSLMNRTSFQLDKQPVALGVTGSKDELLMSTAKLDVPQHPVLGTETGLTLSSSDKSTISSGFAPEKTSTKSVSKESIRRTSSTAKAAGSKEQILSASANEDVTQRKVVGKDSLTSTDANNYSLSTGAQLTMTQKCSTRWKNDAPIQQSFFEKVEGSNYQKSFDSALQRSQHPSSGVKEDFQSFQVTTSSEPSPAAVQSPLRPEPLRTKSPLDLTAQHASERKEQKVESATALTPMPDFPLLGSTPKASSEEVRYTETGHKVSDRSDALHWPQRDTSSRLGEAAALFDTSLQVSHSDQRPIQTGPSRSTERIEQAARVETQAGASAESPRKRLFGPQTHEEFERAQVAEPLIKPQTAHLLYEPEQERKVGAHAGHQTHTDSSLIQYTPQDSILAEIVREVERKIEASARYHVEPLPDDVLTVRSSKGIESLGRLKYETYGEELLMRRSEDDLKQEAQKATTEVAEKALTGAEPAKKWTDQKAHSGAIEDIYSAADKVKVTDQEPAALIRTGAQPTEDTTKEAKVKTEELVSGATEREQEESRVTVRESEQRAQFRERETEAKKPGPGQRKRPFEQHGKVSSVSEAQKKERKASFQESTTIDTTQKVGSIAAQDKTEDREAKVYVKKHETQETSDDDAVRRFIAAAIEEAAKREEASKSVKRFREFPCSAEESRGRVHGESLENFAMEFSAEQERRIEEIKIHKEKSLPQLARCKSIAALIEQIIQQHVSGTDVSKHAIVLERQEAARRAEMARPPGFHTSIVQQEIPVYYQTATTSHRLGDQYVQDYQSSLLGVPRKGDGNMDQPQLESTSQGERRISFSSRGARCVIRKLEPGALTYLIEVAPTDKSQENQTDMVMAEEQVLVSEIFDHIMAPSMRVSSSGSRLNEPITVSPAASLTAIRNAYAEAVARRVLSGRSASGAEGVLGPAQKAQFFEEKQWSKDGKSSSSTSLPSTPSVEDYMLQSMLASGVLKNKAHPWIKKTSKLEVEVSTRAPSMDKLAKTAASSEGIVAPPTTPLRNVESTAGTEGGTGSSEDAAQDRAAQAPKDDGPPNALFASLTAKGAAASAFSEAKKPAVAAGAVGSAEHVSSAAVVSERASKKTSETTTTTVVTSEHAVAKQPSASSLKDVVRTTSSSCTVCKKQIPAEKAFESPICFGRHDVPKYWANVSSAVSKNIKLRIATDDDVRKLVSLPFKDADSACVVPAAVVTRHILCPSGFFVAVDASQGSICGAASVITFDEEVAFCGFCHIFEDYTFQEIGALLWNQMLHLTNGKNLFTLLSEPASQELVNIYHFPSNPATSILFGTARMSRKAFARTILALEYKDKYFDALASYDKHVFGFNRKRYLASTVHEVGLDIRVATRNERNICGYGGIQRDEVGRRILRWLFADDAETAESLLSSLLASCGNEDEVDLIAAFFLRSNATRPILDKIGSRELKPWRLLYTKREPVHSYGRIVALTTV